jgi:negative regulator of sigma E activity
MEDRLKEKLCLLLDNELSPDESLSLLHLIETDPEVQKQWIRYSLVREAMRSGRVLIPDSRFVNRVSTVLADEPTILAPRTGARRWRERVVTGALAASLALGAVLVAKSLNNSSLMQESNFLTLANLMGASAQVPVDSEFQDYLLTHYQAAYSAGAPGMLPSVRLVSAETNH